MSSDRQPARGTQGAEMWFRGFRRKGYPRGF